MYAADKTFQPEKATPNEISKQDVGKTYQLKGNITDIYSAEAASFFTLKTEHGSIEAIDFGDNKIENRKATVEGKIDLHQGDAQLVASNIQYHS
jgi:RecJ-like exonuclease